MINIEARVNLKGRPGKNDIKINELENDILTSDDYIEIEKLANRLRIGYIIMTFCGLFVSGLVSLETYDSILSSHGSLVQQFPLILTTFLFFSLPIRAMINLCHVRNGSFKKAKYGVVQTKHRSIRRENHRRSKRYYAHVSFPHTDKILKRVTCSKETYNAISEGSPILVVSFDGKNAYAILTKESKRD